MLSEAPSQAQLQAQDFETITLATDTCLLLYKSFVIQHNGDVTDFAKRSSIWVNCDGQWQVRYHQGTPCAAFAIGSTK